MRPLEAPGFSRGECHLFTLFALSTDKIALDQTASGALVGFMLNGSALGKGYLTGSYGR